MNRSRSVGASSVFPGADTCPSRRYERHADGESAWGGPIILPQAIRPGIFYHRDLAENAHSRVGYSRTVVPPARAHLLATTDPIDSHYH